MQRDVIESRQDARGFEIRKEKLTYGEDEPVEVESTYTQKGEYIGDLDTAGFLYGLGIEPECIPGNQVCSIGFSAEGQQWYGWSHRALCGFSVGDVVKKGDCTASSGWTKAYLKEHPEADRSLPIGFKAKTLDDCKRMAIAFADSVS